MSTPKRIFYGDDARARILGGMKILYDAVKPSYGSGSGNAIIDDEYGVRITHDGISIAESISVPQVDDETLGFNTGIELIKQAARNSERKLHDATSGTTVLTYCITKGSNRIIAAGYNPLEVSKGIRSAADEILADLGKLAKPVKSEASALLPVATTSAEDETIGKIVAETIAEVGKDGIVIVEGNPELGHEHKADIVEGYNIGVGWTNPRFITDPTRQKMVAEKAAIIVTDQKLNTLPELMPLLETLLASGRTDIVIFADEVEGEALGFLIYNKGQRLINPVVVAAPAYGDRRREIFEDIATMTGAKIISDFSDENVIQSVGFARKVIVGKDDTTIIEGGGSDEAVQARVSQLKTQAEESTEDNNKSYYAQRAAALDSKVSVIKVGGNSYEEIFKAKGFVDDAIGAAKAALVGGVVAGGGITLLNLADKIVIDGIDSINAGRLVLKNALQEPFLHLTENAGFNSQALLVAVKKAKPGFGVDLNSNGEELVDMTKAGIVDPLLAVEWILKNAVSIAADVATMETLPVRIPEETK